jgi:signal peptidase II
MSPKRLLLILAILCSCVGCDQATKSVAKAYLSETQPVILLGDTVLAALLLYLFVSRPQNPLVGVSIALVVGGGVSNLIDRLRYGGYVVDFLNVGIGSLRTGIFNVADMAIMAGVLLWAFSDRLWGKKESQAEA